jgi:hypothetical protein
MPKVFDSAKEKSLANNSAVADLSLFAEQMNDTFKAVKLLC